MKKEKKPKKEKQAKGGKKKLLIPLALIVVAAVAAAVVLFVLPRFGINLMGGGDSSEVGDPLPKKGLEAYTIEEDTTISLDTVLEEGDGELIANRGPGKKPTMQDEPGVISERYTYIYELTAPADVVNRYLDIMLGAEQGFSLTDETYLVQEERPELVNEEGALILARASTQENHLFQIVIGWSAASGNLAVRVSAPEGALSFPEPEEEPEPASLDEHMAQLKAMNPAQLGLSGSSMDEYEIYAMEGFVTVDGIDCRRFTIYPKGETGSIAGIFLISSDKQHFYQLDQTTNAVTELR